MPVNLVSRRYRDRVYDRLPRWVIDQPHEAFVSLLAIIGAVPLLLGEAQNKTVEDTLPPTLVAIWGALLMIGSVATLWGLIRATRADTLMRRIRHRRSERFGLILLSYAAYIYSLCILSLRGVTTIPSLVIVLAFALTCSVRALVIDVRIHRYLAMVIATGEAPPAEIPAETDEGEVL